MTEELFRHDAYLRHCDARVVAADERGIRLDKTVFYPLGGGQPGDVGVLRTPDGTEIAITDTRKDKELSDIVHIPADGAAALAPDTEVTAEIDWERRHRHMRMHTCMHLLCAVITGEVTGGQLGADKGRLDFNLPDTRLDKERLSAELNRLVQENHAVSTVWITDEELDAKPDLVRTMSVKPPRGAGKVRLLDINDVDLQPCGGTHVAHTGEIGRVKVRKIESKGKQNRRVIIVFDE
ncbi:MAG: alanyl-tRNA editing protein [Gammaproteobacteria bacterium]